MHAVINLFYTFNDSDNLGDSHFFDLMHALLTENPNSVVLAEVFYDIGEHEAQLCVYHSHKHEQNKCLPAWILAIDPGHLPRPTQTA